MALRPSLRSLTAGANLLVALRASLQILTVVESMEKVAILASLGTFAAGKSIAKVALNARQQSPTDC